MPDLDALYLVVKLMLIGMTCFGVFVIIWNFGCKEENREREKMRLERDRVNASQDHMKKREIALDKILKELATKSIKGE